MNEVLPTSHPLTWVVLAGSLLAAAALVSAPSLPEWGERHQPHHEPKSLLLPSGQRIGQSFAPIHSSLDAIAVWLDPAAGWPREGNLLIELEAGGRTSAATATLANIPESGLAVFQFPRPIRSPQGSEARLFVSLDRSDQRVALRYQIDATKYTEGALLHFDPRKQGDLAFQIRYRRPALGSRARQLGYATTIAAAGVVLAAALRQSQPHRILTDQKSRADTQLAFILGGVTALFYLAFFWQPGWWVGPSDFVKDTSYITASAAAVRQSTWPVWSHLTCGGMPLLGNPEGNTFSLATLLALLLEPEQALWLTLALEAGLGAAGAYLFARSLHASRLAGILAAFIYSLSGVYAYRLAEGFSMLGGPMALIPWVFLGVQKGSVLMGGLALAGMFLRGDVHVVIGVLAIVVLWCMYTMLRTRTWQPVRLLAGIAALAFLAASIKVLPYLEQPKLIGGTLHPYVAPLAQQGLLDEVFFKLPSRSVKIPVLHGELPEHYGNFGAYIGLLPVLLAVVGLLTKNRFRPYLLIGAAASFVLAEGTLFEYALRHIPPLDALLRVPTRLLPIFVLFVGILAAIGLDRIRIRSSVGRLLAAVITAFVLIDLASASSTILTDNLWQRTTGAVTSPQQPTLAPHANFSRADVYYAGTLLRAGYLLPHVCGDQNNPPEFLGAIENPTLIASLPAHLAPNTTHLNTPADPGEYRIAQRFVPAFSADRGIVIPADDGSVVLLTPRSNGGQEVTLRYLSATTRSQQILTGLLVVLTAGLFAPKHGRGPRK